MHPFVEVKDVIFWAMTRLPAGCGRPRGPRCCLPSCNGLLKCPLVETLIPSTLSEVPWKPHPCVATGTSLSETSELFPFLETTGKGGRIPGRHRMGISPSKREDVTSVLFSGPPLAVVILTG